MQNTDKTSLKKRYIYAVTPALGEDEVSTQDILDKVKEIAKNQDDLKTSLNDKVDRVQGEIENVQNKVDKMSDSMMALSKNMIGMFED